jgi:predicted phage tail protein
MQVSGAGGGGGCFLGDTLVRTPSGQQRIDTLRQGEFVISFDDCGNLYEAKVLQVHVHENEPVVRYFLWGGTYLDATPNHWVLNQFNAFVAIGTLGEDDCLVDENGHLRPIVNRQSLPLGTVYNLTVEGKHTFIAGGIRVHNAGLGPGFTTGAGGGGGSKGSGGSYTPSTAPDSLNSTAFVKIIDLLGEGEIEGFPSARAYTRDTPEYNTALLKDVFFDKTPVLRASANVSAPSATDFNFRNVTLTPRYGTGGQTYIPGFEQARNEKSVGVVVSSDGPITRTITDSDVDRVRVTLTFSALQEFRDNGDIVGSAVHYQVQVAYTGGTFATVIDFVLTGRTGDAFQRTETIAINGAFPVQVRVVRITPDATDSKIQNTFSWSSYTEVTDAKLAYPYSALVGIQVNAKDFSSIPLRSYRVRGLRVKLPTNATVDYENGRVIYSGVWDGTFQAAAWCSDPAWCLWDLLTNYRYGFNLATRDLDKFSFYQASVYCNELVDNGLGGQEPRFSCNISIQNITEAYKLINDMCSVFRAMPYWSAGSIMIAQDRPTDPVYLFNQTNITEEGFQYTGSSLKTRHTVAIVGYLDLENQEVAYESVEDLEGIARYGVITAEITAFACTSRSQAYRLGEWLLYTEQYENETVTFKTSIDAGINVRPGMVIAISDPVRSGVRRGGRITAATSTYILIDEVAATNLPLGGSPTILVALTDGTVATKTVTSVSGDRINISGSFDAPPLIGGVFIYNDNSMSSTTWRVLGVQEQNGTEYAINAVSYNSSKYDYIERGRSLVRKTYPPLSVPTPTEPTNASTAVASYEADGQLQNKLLIDWQGDPAAVEYEVRYRLVG